MARILMKTFAFFGCVGLINWAVAGMFLEAEPQAKIAGIFANTGMLVLSLILMGIGMIFAMFSRRSSPHFVVESQSGDTGAWESIATTDDLEQARGLLTSKYRRIVDCDSGQIIAP